MGYVQGFKGRQTEHARPLLTAGLQPSYQLSGNIGWVYLFSIQPVFQTELLLVQDGVFTLVLEIFC